MKKNKNEKIKEEIEKRLKSIKMKPKRLNCVATEQCQINFEQQSDFGKTL